MTAFTPTYLDFLLQNPEFFDGEIKIPLHQGELWLKNLGVWEYWPSQSSINQKLILSCGIHGNETAPIEILNDLLQDILEEKIIPTAPVQLIFGNPLAMAQAKRFIDFNLNRLFCGKHLDQSHQVYEKGRAQTIEKSLLNFIGHTQCETIHFDLHTAIRKSQHLRFAVQPSVEDNTYSKKHLNLLQAMGVEAVLLSSTPTPTFSHFSSFYGMAFGFTVELGKVKPFGQNDRSQFKACEEVLRNLIKGQEQQGDYQKITYYQVKRELVRDQENYQFFIADKVSNFTPFPVGSRLDSHYSTAEIDERIVFPKGDVKIGQRSGLVVMSKAYQKLKFR